ncbi:phosphoglycerate kinase [Euryhalocaulis caribicus]|uniref:phosphoglycerate kinase n=1 Tax=Euryhalocaulis caribicus TaxID=1161401 RepID=UPI00039B2C86|nr:phosphoglycerate kinase [Euryhalocaulis caribicus]
MTRIHRLEDAELAGKRVLVRVDFNVPLKDGAVADASRIEAALPTIRYLKDKGARIALISHLGRPKGKRAEEFSLAPIQPVLAELLDTPVLFVPDCVGDEARQAAEGLMQGGVALFENLRFHEGEEANDPAFARALAEPFDLFVEDAFSVSHRAHASTEGVTHHLPAFAGKALAREIDHLSTVLRDPKRPMMAVIGGAKVSTKIDVLMALVEKADILAIGGGMANTFMSAKGIDVGKSLNEPDYADTARKIMDAARTHGCEIMLPADVVVAEKFEANAPSRTVSADRVGQNEMILDAGPESVDAIAEAIEEASTLLWNGPLGAFEITPFDTATVEAAKYAAKQARAGKLVAVAGGGDTVAALRHAGAYEDFTYVSNAGGAFLEWVEGRALPGVEALKR